MKQFIRVFFFAVLVLALPSSPSYAQKKNNVVFIVDISGSMREPAGKETKIAAAKKAFNETMSRISPATNVGLMVFGRQRAKDCRDIEVVSHLGVKSAQALATSIDNYQPRGETPIAATLLQAKDLFAAQKGENNSIVLITDGREECNKKKRAVCEAAEELKASGIGLKVHIVGLGHKSGDREAVECVAQITGGEYVAASDGPSLVKAIEKLPDVIAQGPPSPPLPPPSTPTGCAVKPLSGDMRQWVREGAIRVQISHVQLTHGGANHVIHATIQNCSGAGLGIAIAHAKTNISNCRAHVASTFSLVGVLSNDYPYYPLNHPAVVKQLQWFLSDDQKNGTILLDGYFAQCGLQPGSAVTVNLGILATADEKTSQIIEHSIPNVPVR